MDWTLSVSAMLLGLAGAPHCAAMCGAACAAMVRRDEGMAWVSFHVFRIAGYSAAGAIAASSISALSTWGRLTPAVRPLWTLAHVAALALGLWLLVRGRQPAWLEKVGSTGRCAAPQAGGWQQLSGPLRAGTAGSLWVAWPCGLLQSALVVAALSNGAAGGALSMALFAMASATGLVAAPWLWRRLGGATPGAAAAWATRASGLLLAVASAWALGHGLWQQVAAFCGL